MLFWIQYPFIRITASYCIGLILGNLTDFSYHSLSAFIICGSIIYLLLLYLSPSKFRKFNVLLGAFSILLLVAIGYTSVGIRNPENNPNHILNHNKAIECYVVNVSNCLKSTNNFIKIIGRINAIKDNKGWKQSEGKILLYFPLSEEIRYGDQFLIKKKPESISSPLNPGEFDYRSFLKHKRIYHSNFLRSTDYIQLSSNPFSFLKKAAENSRIWITEKINSLYTNQISKGIVLALLTGQKDLIDQDTYNNFVNTGVIHILAISGLHVGIIYLILLGICYPFPDTLAIKIIKWLFIICVLVFFAFLTGLQASVLRAVLMFSLVHTGRIINRSTNSLNSVSLSAFILLLINPDYIYSVGFQLSYAAVLGILLISPTIKTLLIPKSRIMVWLWNLGSISISAQLGTLPLTLYYFKQFPIYFIFSNYIAIPYAGITIVLGLTSILFYPIHIIQSILPSIIEFITKNFIHVIQFINKLPFAVISPININLTQSFFLLLSIYFFVQGIYNRKILILLSAISLIILIISIDLISVLPNKSIKEISVYNIPGMSCIEMTTGNQSIMLIEDSTEKKINTVQYYTMGNTNLKNRKVKIYDISNLEEIFPSRHINGVSITVWNNLTIGITIEKIKQKSKELEKINLDLLIIRKNYVDIQDIRNFSIQSKRIIWDSSSKKFDQNNYKFTGCDSIHIVAIDGFFNYDVKDF